MTQKLVVDLEEKKAIIPNACSNKGFNNVFWRMKVFELK